MAIELEIFAGFNKGALVLVRRMSRQFLYKSHNEPIAAPEQNFRVFLIGYLTWKCKQQMKDLRNYRNVVAIWVSL